MVSSWRIDNCCPYPLMNIIVPNLYHAIFIITNYKWATTAGAGAGAEESKNELELIVNKIIELDLEQNFSSSLVILRVNMG